MMNKVVVSGLGILLADALLCSALWAALVRLPCSCWAALEGVWAFSAVRWATLHLFTSRLTDGKPRTVLVKFVALLCLLSPTLESGRALMGAPSKPGSGPIPGFGVLLQSQAASVLACVIWELWLSDGKMKKTSSKVNSSQLFLRLLRYFRSDTLYIIAAFTFLIMAVVCESLIPFYQGKVIDMLKGQVDESSFCHTIGQLALVSFGSALFSGLRGGTFMCTLMRLNRRLKHLLFHSLLQQEVNFFQDKNTGSLSARLHSDVDMMGRTVALNANAMVRSVVKTGLVLGLMLSLSWELTVLTLIEIPLTAIVQSKHISLSNELKKKIQDCHAQNEGIALQSLSMIRTVRSFNAESEEARRYDKALEELRVLKNRKGIHSVMFGIIYKFLKHGIRLLTLLEARSLISSGRLTVGTLVSFFLYQKPVSRSLTEILHSYGNTASTVKVIAAVFGYLDRRPECRTEGELAPERLEGRVVFQDVTFTYPSAALDKPALKSVSFEVQAGKMTALVGPSGSGKTSCISLLKRLYEAQEGQILLDGKPLHHYKIKYLQQKVASVSQNPELFSGSLRYNIQYGLKDCSLEKVKAAAKAAQADGFISALENGYDTDLGDCGDKLSNGQQHSIGIVRALVRDPQVVVLDETTGKVDAEVWHAVLREVLTRGGTVLVVAHKLKTVEMAARIIFLENGQVMEEGTHTELLAKRGRYYDFSQSYE